MRQIGISADFPTADCSSWSIPDLTGYSDSWSKFIFHTLILIFLKLSWLFFFFFSVTLNQIFDLQRAWCEKVSVAAAAAAAAKSLQSCLTLCDPIRQPNRLPCPWDSAGKNTGMGCISFFNAWKWKVKVKPLGRVRLVATPWAAAREAHTPLARSHVPQLRPDAVR